VIPTGELVLYLDDILETATVPDYPGAVNGLQLANRGRVTSVAASVDFSTTAVNAAITAGADLLLVHHGMFWSGTRPITGVHYERLRSLLDNDIAVYSSHLPLDRHPQFGNNVLLSEQLGLAVSGEFASFKGRAIGVRGECDVATAEVVRRAGDFAAHHGGTVIATPFKDGKHTRQWAICTGAGASAETLQEALATGIDTLIVGEGPHWTAVEAADTGLTIIYAGHYATETLGVAALGRHIADRYGLDFTAVIAPTGL
jgi:dinuclear metal center YbgI/SA1388 family protein